MQRMLLPEGSPNEDIKGTQAFCTPIQTISDLLSDLQVLENEYILDYEHPVFGRIKTVGFPWSFSKTPASLRLPAPQLDSILRKSSLSLAILGMILAT